MNYGEYVQAIQDYTANTDATFVASIPTFVQSAEYRIYSAVKLPAKSFYSYAAVTPNNRFLSMPSTFLDVQQLARLPVGGAGAHEFLLQKDITFIRECWPDPADAGPPKVYGMLDANTLMLGPTPDAAYRMEMQYTAYPESIVTAGNTWLGDFQFNALLYGALVEAYTFMKGDEDMIKQYASLLSDAVAQLKQYTEIDVRSSTYRHAKAPE